MVEDLDSPTAIARELAHARAELDDFEAGVDRARMVARLKADKPWHPVIWSSRVGLMAFGALLLAAVSWTAAVALGLPIPTGALRVLEASNSLPGSMVLSALALCALAFAAAMRELASELGEVSPMLVWETKTSQRLHSEVMRLRAKQAVEQQVNATPAPAYARSA